MRCSKYLSIICAAAAAGTMTGCAIFSTGECKDENSMNYPIKIGWAKRSIAPKEGTAPITGQFYLRVALGQYTPVLTSAMVMENGSDAVIFVSADMVSVPPVVLKKVKANLAKEAPEIPGSKIIINATHTHAGPAANGPEDAPYPNTVDFIPAGKMQDFIARQMTDAIKEAWEKRDFGSISYGYGHAMTGYSRRSVYLDDISKREAARPGIAMNGRAKMYGRTNDDMFDGYEAGTETFINLLYTFDKKGKLTGAVINVPCPSQTVGTAWYLHASFWHNVREKLSAKYGDITIITQSAAAGDLCPQQLHYLQAEKRRFALKYPEMLKKYMENPMKYPAGLFPKKENYDAQYAYDCMEFLRAEDMAQRITEAFDEVLSWAGKEKFCKPELKHEVKTLKLSRRQFPKELVEQERANHENFMKQEFISQGNKYYVLQQNSALNSRRHRCGGVVKRYEEQAINPKVVTNIHVVKIGNIAFASNRFELFMDYMHRIQARSPFEQTFIVQLVTDDYGVGSYLATERAIANKGYSATPYCNQASPEGGQELVNATLDVLKELKK